MPLGTVLSRVSRARRRLREVLMGTKTETLKSLVIVVHFVIRHLIHAARVRSFRQLARLATSRRACAAGAEGPDQGVACADRTTSWTSGCGAWPVPETLTLQLHDVPSDVALDERLADVPTPATLAAELRLVSPAQRVGRRRAASWLDCALAASWLFALTVTGWAGGGGRGQRPLAAGRRWRVGGRRTTTPDRLASSRPTR